MSALSELRPTQSQRLIDLVRAAGIDVSDWANFKGGRAKAASNPKYCYEWSYVVPAKLIVLNLWHDQMTERPDGVVLMEWNPKEFASKRRGVERARGMRADDAIKTAVKDELPVRVIILGGTRRDINNPEHLASQVSMRLLDPMSWTINSYDSKTGQCTLTRGSHRFVDQFSIQEPTDSKPERRDVSGQAFVRSASVRAGVLLRANGKCEWCEEPGFSTAGGGIFLETHHVIPLNENGPDIVTNVAALCPNHHREAHHGNNRDEMRRQLMERLRSYRAQ
jgi:5-methylcytosine-specific restriction protein A